MTNLNIVIERELDKLALEKSRMSRNAKNFPLSTLSTHSMTSYLNPSTDMNGLDKRHSAEKQDYLLESELERVKMRSRAREFKENLEFQQEELQDSFILLQDE